MMRDTGPSEGPRALAQALITREYAFLFWQFGLACFETLSKQTCARSICGFCLIVLARIPSATKQIADEPQVRPNAGPVLFAAFARTPIFFRFVNILTGRARSSPNPRRPTPGTLLRKWRSHVSHYS